MTQNNNYSVLPFYKDLNEQNHRKSYAYGAIFPLITPKNILLPFQFMREQRRVEIESYVDIEASTQADGRIAIDEMNPTQVFDGFYIHNLGNEEAISMQTDYYALYYAYVAGGYKVTGLQEIDVNEIRALYKSGNKILNQYNVISSGAGEIFLPQHTNVTVLVLNNKTLNGENVTKVFAPKAYMYGKNATFTLERNKRYQAKVESLATDFPLAIYYNGNNYVGEQYITQEQLGAFVELEIPSNATKVLLNSGTNDIAELQRIDVTYEVKQMESVTMYDKNGVEIADLTSAMTDAGLQVVATTEDVDVVLFPANMYIDTEMNIGQYYISMTDGVETWYSEIFTIVESVAPYLKIEWWDVENLMFDSGIIVYDVAQFKNILYLCTELGKPEYQFEEEGETRNGYFFPQKQISEKTYKATALAPEYLCDAMRFIRMADYVQITDKYGRRYNADTFLITPKWQTQGDLASVEIEFETDTVVKKIGKGYTL